MVDEVVVDEVFDGFLPWDEGWHGLFVVGGFLPWYEWWHGWFLGGMGVNCGFVRVWWCWVRCVCIGFRVSFVFLPWS